MASFKIQTSTSKTTYINNEKLMPNIVYSEKYFCYNVIKGTS